MISHVYAGANNLGDGLHEVPHKRILHFQDTRTRPGTETRRGEFAGIAVASIKFRAKSIVTGRFRCALAPIVRCLETEFLSLRRGHDTT